jgi:hypothetical protein
MAKGYKMVKPLGSLTKKRLKPTSQATRSVAKSDRLAKKKSVMGFGGNDHGRRKLEAKTYLAKKKVKGSIARNPGKTALALGAVGAAGTAGIVHKNREDKSMKGRIRKALKR